MAMRLHSDAVSLPMSPPDTRPPRTRQYQPSPARQEDVADFVRAGARGFVMKDASFEDFIRTIRFVAAFTCAQGRSLSTATWD